MGFSDTGVYGTNSANSMTTVDISDVAGARRAIDIIDLALEDVTQLRSDFGALQNA